jgi:hypothetical protein
MRKKNVYKNTPSHFLTKYKKKIFDTMLEGPYIQFFF